MHNQTSENRRDKLLARRDKLLTRRQRVLPPAWYTAILIGLTALTLSAWVWILAIASVSSVTITHLAEAAMLGAVASGHGVGWILMYYTNRRCAEADEIREIDRELDAERAVEQDAAWQRWLDENVWDVISGMAKPGTTNGQVLRPPFPRRTGVPH